MARCLGRRQHSNSCQGKTSSLFDATAKPFATFFSNNTHFNAQIITIPILPLSMQMKMNKTVGILSHLQHTPNVFVLNFGDDG